jgi:hypothetical protein
MMQGLFSLVIISFMEPASFTIEFPEHLPTEKRKYCLASSATEERRLNDMLTTYFESSARSRGSWLMSAGCYSIPTCRTCAE